MPDPVPAAAALPWAGRDDTLHLNYDLGPLGMSQALWPREVLRRGLTHTANTSWYVDAPDLDLLEEDVEVLASHRSPDHKARHLLIDAAGVLLNVSLDIDGEMHLWVAARTAAEVDAQLGALRAAYPRREPPEGAEQVEVVFWSLGPDGTPSGRSRRIDVQAWDGIEANYVPDVSRELGRVFSDEFAPGDGGQIHLWQGPPGTGKTYALRSLAWEWRKWCDLHYITDPEAFFGQSATYMLSVLLRGDDEPATPSHGDAAPVKIDPRATDGRWRLLVLEDAGELMSADAKERAGAGLGRLLNVVDGLIGQGLRILVLVTTNEEVRNLHPAVTRPGRAASVVRFEAFTQEQAAEWLAERDSPREPGAGHHTAAELYALLEGRGRDAEPAGMGFGR